MIDRHQTLVRASGTRRDFGVREALPNLVHIYLVQLDQIAKRTHREVKTR